MLSAIAAALPLSARAAASGKCGNNLTWSFNSANHTLTISGSGAMYDYSDYGMSPWSGYNDDIAYINIGSSVTTIGDYAFSMIRNNLTYVTIPNSVTRIGDGAFSLCEALTHIQIPYNVTEIGIGAFHACTNMDSVTFGGDSVKSIGMNAFLYCNSLTDVYFDEGFNLYNIELENKYSNPFCLADNAYVWSNGAYKPITSVSVPSNVKKIGDYTFFNCTFLTSVTIPGGVTSFGDYAISCCEGLTSLTIPSSVTSLGDYAVSYCTNLKSLMIPSSVTSIGNGAFAGCDGLTSIAIPKTVTKIGDYTFGSCESLKSVTIPNSVKSIGNEAFYNCASLTNITIPDSVTSMGDYIFSRCPKLTDVILSDNITAVGDYTFNECSSLTNVTIPNGVTNIGNYAFNECSSLTSVTIPNRVTSIGAYAFNGCTSLSGVTIPDSVTSVGDLAFSGLTSLTELTVGSGVTNIGKSVFKDCTNLTKINWNAKNEPGISSSSYIFYNAGRSGNGIEVVFGDGVTSVPQNLFSTSAATYAPNITSIRFFADVESIGNNAFRFPVYLKSVFVDENNRNYSSAGGVLFNKNKTELILYPAKSAVTDYSIPDGVTSIGNNAFYYCDGLKSVAIPNSVITIGDSAFYYCSSLTSVTVPYGVTAIGNNAFYHCDSLKSLTLPNSIKSIGNSVISFCSDLTDVYYLGTKEEWDKIDMSSSADMAFTRYIRYISKINIRYKTKSGTDTWRTDELIPGTSSAAITTEIPYRTGHAFLGWSTYVSAAEAKYKPGDTIPVGMEDITLYAVWKKVSYTSTTSISGIFMVTPSGVPNGSSIILACYKDGELVHIGKFEYDGGASVPFYVNTEYDKINVFVWDKDVMSPVTETENVSL